MVCCCRAGIVRGRRTRWKTKSQIGVCSNEYKNNTLRSSLQLMLFLTASSLFPFFCLNHTSFVGPRPLPRASLSLLETVLFCSFWSFSSSYSSSMSFLLFFHLIPSSFCLRAVVSWRYRLLPLLKFSDHRKAARCRVKGSFTIVSIAREKMKGFSRSFLDRMRNGRDLKT